MAAPKRERPRMGRPPGPPELVRRHRLQVSLSDAEREQLERLAEREGLPLGTVLHRIVARSLGRARRA
jgi:hypothetical protein